jgi:hypothetical protein
VTFEGNVASADKGGYASSGIDTDSIVDVDGITFIGNKVPVPFNAGGTCIYALFGAKINVNGPFCAHDNVAVVTPGSEIQNGACVWLEQDASAHFNQPSTANIANNKPYDVLQLYVQDNAKLTCGGSTSSWTGGVFIITGPVCGCNDEFVVKDPGPDPTQIDLYTCNSCGRPGWSNKRCACVRTALMFPGLA